MKETAAALLIAVLAALPLRAEEKKINPREVDKQLFDVLKDIHNRGADMFNAGDAAGSYRLFQGSLRTARAVLAHRPAEQKFIDDGMAEAEKQATIGQRAFVLHEAIEKLRIRLRAASEKTKGKADPETLSFPPRELMKEKKDPAPKKIVPPKDGVMGRIFWKGTPLPGAEVTFVSRGAIDIKVYEATSDAEGHYVLQKVRPGKYTVLLTKSGKQKQVLPDRYATATTSPLIVDVKGGGDTLDFLLQ